MRIDSLTVGDLRYLLPQMSEKQHYQLGRAFSFAQRSFRGGGGEGKYTLEQLLYAVRQSAEGKRELGRRCSMRRTIRRRARWFGV